MRQLLDWIEQRTEPQLLLIVFGCVAVGSALLALIAVRSAA